MPAAIAADAEWRYWKARALQETGQKGEARGLFSELARERSYHGYLAADQLGQSYAFNARRAKKNAAAAKQVEDQSEFARARELYALDMPHAAYQEWQLLISDLDQPELIEAARKAHDWGWHNQAII